MTVWALYCIFADVWSDADKSGLHIQARAWQKVCVEPGKAADICEEMEVTEGWGLRGHPFVVSDGGGIVAGGDGVAIIQGKTTCQKWVKTTDKFPWQES